MGLDDATVVWLDWKILKMKGCPDVVVVVMVLIPVVDGLPNKFPSLLVDDAITLFPTLLVATPTFEANKPVKLGTFLTKK